MTNRRTFLGVIGGVALAVASGSAALAQDVTLRLHQFLPAQANVPRLILDVWADNVERDSGALQRRKKFLMKVSSDVHVSLLSFHPGFDGIDQL